MKIIFTLITALLLAPLASLHAAEIAFATEPYETPEITTAKDGSTTINVPKPPAGLYYLAKLDPARAYRIHILGGRTDGGPFSLRIRRGEGAPEYHPAAKRDEHMNISDCSSVELLIYNGSQAPGKFSFRALSIEDITGLGHANSDLKALILKETPGLAEALKNKQIWLAEKLVLRWAAPRITWDGGGYALATSGYDAAQIYYDFFQPHTMGVYCGGSSDFLHKVLNLFGLPNFPMDFGTHKPNLTHVTVIVPLPNPSGGTDYRLLDPTWNMELVLKKTGEPVDLFTAWELARASRADEVEVRSVDLGGRFILMKGGSKKASDFKPHPGDCYWDRFIVEWAPIFKEAGYEANLSGFLHLLGTSQIFSTNIPKEFVEKHNAFKKAASEHDESVHIAPLPPK